MKSICMDPSAYKSNDTILISLKCCSSPLPFKLIAPSRQRLLSFMDQPSGEPQGTAWNNRECIRKLPNFTYCLAGPWDLVILIFFRIYFPFPTCTAKVSEPWCARLKWEFQFAIANSRGYRLSPAWAPGTSWILCFLAEEKTRETSSLRNPGELWGFTRGLPGREVGGKNPWECQSSANRFVNGGALL